MTASTGPDPKKALVFGAGVIGQVYAGRLAEAGHQVALLARGSTYGLLSEHGLRLTRDGSVSTPQVEVIEAVGAADRYDVALIAVRGDQVQDALPAVANLPTDVVVFLCNLVDTGDEVAAHVGTGRTVLAFPGVGGTRGAGGVTYHEIKQQPTTVARCGGGEQVFVQMLRDASMSVAETDDMAGWLATHAVFVVGVGAAILAAEGDAAGLAGDRTLVHRMIDAVREGFTALEGRGTRVNPRPLKTIFSTVPSVFSIPYWQRQLRGELGTLAIAPHVNATRDTEFPLLVERVRRLVGPARAPHLDALLDAAGYPVGRTEAP